MKGYDKLGDFGQQVFDRTHKRHLAAMGTAEKPKYHRDRIKSVRANNKERCIEVKFNNGELFKYYADGTWG
ncbi:hypothetical protein [Halalkalibacter oceani]|uniref:hypothetical protein n=1 Tax=Halalkalibacter oceani TaxID=1653776 RepID=UPI00339901DE